MINTPVRTTSLRIKKHNKNQMELEQLCHYTNLQPLWWYDNLSKGNEI